MRTPPPPPPPPGTDRPGCIIIVYYAYYLHIRPNIVSILYVYTRAGHAGLILTQWAREAYIYIIYMHS